VGLERSSGGATLVDVLDRVLDKGIVIDAWVRVSIAGLEVVTVEARIVVASIETYLQHSEALGASRRASLPREKTWATGAALASAAGSRGLDRSGGPRNKPSAAIPFRST